MGRKKEVMVKTFSDWKPFRVLTENLELQLPGKKCLQKIVKRLFFNRERGGGTEKMCPRSIYNLNKDIRSQILGTFFAVYSPFQLLFELRS